MVRAHVILNCTPSNSRLVHSVSFHRARAFIIFSVLIFRQCKTSFPTQLPMTTKSNIAIPTAQLSCEQCQQRKTKCSKTVPCAACVKAGIPCTAVQRHRLPRGRSRAQRRDASTVHALTDRIARLEAVVAQYQQNGSSDHDAVCNCAYCCVSKLMLAVQPTTIPS